MEGNNSKVSLIVGILFVVLGFIMLIGLMSFAMPCHRLLDNGMPARCDSLGFMQRGLALVVMAIGIFMVMFRRFGYWLKGLGLAAFLMGVFIIISAVLTDTCNVRAHTLAIGETPQQENFQLHQVEITDFYPEQNIYIVWTNFRCNTGSFTPFVIFMGIFILLLGAVYAFFINTAPLPLKICFKNMGILFIVLGVFTMVALVTFVPPCLDFAGMTLMPMFMRCYDVAVVIHGISAITVVAGILMILFSPLRDFHKGFNIVVILLGVLAFVIPFITETCANPAMICNERPFGIFISVMGGLIFLAAVGNAIYLGKKKEDEDEALNDHQNSL